MGLVFGVYVGVFSTSPLPPPRRGLPCREKGIFEMSSLQLRASLG